MARFRCSELVIENVLYGKIAMLSRCLHRNWGISEHDGCTEIDMDGTERYIEIDIGGAETAPKLT